MSTPSSEPPPTALLSPRQRQVLAHLALGRSYAEVARRLGISTETVRSYAGQAYRTLGAGNRQEACVIVGWTRVPSELLAG